MDVKERKQIREAEGEVKDGEKGEGSEGKGREKRGSDGDRRIEREMIELREGLRRDKRDCLS